MKNLIIVTAIFLSAIALYSQPKLVFEGGDTHNWGEVRQDQSPLKTEIVIRNDSETDTLLIFKFEPGCGCTNAPLEKNRLAPKESIKVNIVQLIEAYTEEFHKTIAIETNDPDNLATAYHLRAYIFAESELGNLSIALNDMVLNEISSGSIEIKNTGKTPIKILKIKTEPENIKTNLKTGDDIPAQGSVDLKVDYAPEKAEELKGKVMLYTNSRDLRRVTVDIRGRMKR